MPSGDVNAAALEARAKQARDILSFDRGFQPGEAAMTLVTYAILRLAEAIEESR